MEIKKNYKNIFVGIISIILVASCFLPVSSAQETVQGTILTTLTFNADQFSESSISNPQFYYWNFGDGSDTSISDIWDEVYHLFWNVGTYTVQLKIWDTDNNEHNFEKIYEITEPSPGYGNSGLSQPEKEKLNDLAEEFCPVLYVHPTTNHNYPGPVSQIIGNSVLKQKSWLIDPIIDDDPSLDDLRVFSGDTYYLKENDNNDKGDDQKTYVHFRKDTDNGLYFIQYFFFYYYNDAVNDHEGDWEFVQLSFDSEYDPVRATYSQHEDSAGFNWGEKRPWYNVQKHIDGSTLTDHPIVYVSSGGEFANSHANYFYMGDNPWSDYTSECTEFIQFGNDDIIILPNLENDLSGNNNRWLQFGGNWGDCESLFEGPPGPVFRTFENNNIEYRMWTNPYEYETGRSYDGNHEATLHSVYYTMILADQKSTEEEVPVDITAKLLYIDGNKFYPFNDKVLSLYIDGYFHSYETTDEHGQVSFSVTPMICGEQNIDIVFKGAEESSSTGTKHYTWSDRTSTLSVYPPYLMIQSPTTANPARVGDPDDPNEFQAVVTTGSHSYPADAFEVKIGDKEGLYNVYLIDENNNYYFTIAPPTQENEGAYNLEISISAVSTYIEADAVIYSTGGNVDVMTVIDKSGSMGGSKIAAAKTASSLFVDLMQINDRIGVASFGYSGYLNFPLTEITGLSMPNIIRVLDTTTNTVETVDFKDYVKNVLPNEWIAGSWDMDALKAGAMAVKTYGWYWTIHQKYPGQNYDVRDDTSDQVYEPGSSHSRTDQAIDETWDWIMTRNGEIFQSQYIAGTPGDPDPPAGYEGRMSQWGSQYWAENGRDWQWILHYYYDNIDIASGILDIQQKAKNAINSLYASGSTAMGSGLWQGYYQLVNNGNSNHPWSIILLSDGYHNSGTHPYSVLPSIQNENIRVFTIGLGTSVDQNLLQYIADNTGGEYYYSPGTGELTTIYQAIAGVVKAESTVKTGEGIVNVGETLTETVRIDSSIDTATFTLNWESGTCDLTLKRPDDTVVTPSDSDVLSHAVGGNYETFTIEDPADGTWVMEITRTHASSLKYTITVTASADITFYLFTDKDDYYQDEPVHLISTLSNNGNPITGVNVEIVIEKPDGSFNYLTLFDDGYHDDGMALDGVYGNYYTETDQSGSYKINAYASGNIDAEEFTREATKTIQISGIPSEGLSVTPSQWDTEPVYTDDHVVGEFTIDSLSISEETLTITSTDFVNETNIITAENIMFAPETFKIPPGDHKTFYTIIYAPKNAIKGNYTGNIIITSTANSITLPVKLWVAESALPSTIDIDPDTLNLNSGGKWITCYIELPDGYNVSDINISTILLNDTVPAEDHPTNIGDHDNDGIPDLMVKFDRQDVQAILAPGDNVAITVSGKLLDDTVFEGTDYIKVI